MILETGKGSSGKLYIYYNCSGYKKKGICSGQRVNSKKLEEAVLGFMVNDLFSKERLKIALKKVHKAISEMDTQNDSLRKSLTRQMEEIGKKLAKHYSAIEESNGVLTYQDLAERIRGLSNQKRDRGTAWQAQFKRG